MRVPAPRRLLAGLAGSLLCLTIVAPATRRPRPRVVADGLNNPRGVDVAANGHVFVAEAGTGRILEIRGGTVATFTSGLPTATSPEGDITGPVNVSVRTGVGGAVAAIGGGPQNVDPRFDSVLRLSPRPGRVIADVQAYSERPSGHDRPRPAPNPTDSNAYGITSLRGADARADAAATSWT